MNRKLIKTLLLALVLTLPTFKTSMAADFKDSEIMHVEYPDWFVKDPFFDLSEAVAKAKKRGKHGLMIVWHTEGCSYCAVFNRRSLGNPGIAKKVTDNFESVGLEIFDDAEMTHPLGTPMRVKHFAKNEGIGFSPSLLFYDVNGKRILRVVGYQSPERFQSILAYVTGKHYRTESLAEYFNRVSDKQPDRAARAQLKEDPLFTKPPYALDRSRFPASQPMMVLFEKPGCKECDDFHDSVLALKEVRDILKRFEVVRINVADSSTPVITPKGKRATPASWYKQNALTRVPALLFFDEKGNEVLRTDALVMRSRMMNSLSFMVERAYEKGWTYQRQARANAIKRSQKKK